MCRLFVLPSTAQYWGVRGQVVDNGFELHMGMPEGCHAKIAKVVKSGEVTIFDYLSINTLLTSSLTPKIVTTGRTVIFALAAAPVYCCWPCG